MLLRFLILAASPFAATAALAQQDLGLSGRVAFGYLAADGNAESDNLNLTLAGLYETETWHHSLDGLLVRATASGVDTAEAYSLTWKVKHDLGERSYVMGLLGWSRDEFSAYRRQLRQVVGYGRRLLDTETQMLNAEIGAGFRQGRLRDRTEDEDEIIRVSADYKLALSETSGFEQVLAVDTGAANTYLEAVSSLRADVWANTALVFSYTIRRNSVVPLGTGKRDTFTSVSLEYTF